MTSELSETRSLVDETEQLIRIFATSIKTAKANALTESSRVREDSATEDSDHWTLDVFSEAMRSVEGAGA